MTDLKNRSGDDISHAIENIEKYITSISVSNFRTNVPRVNFRKIKLRYLKVKLSIRLFLFRENIVFLWFLS